MRAKLKAQPGSFSERQRKAWKLDAHPEEPDSIRRLLTLAYNTAREINERFFRRCGSGGLQIEDDDPYRELKEKVGFFVDAFVGLPDALTKSRLNEEIDWNGLACWQDIDRIRELLDELPPPATDLQPAESTSFVPETTSPVVLNGPNEQPLVLGTHVPLISQAKHSLVQMLLEAAPRELTAIRIRQTRARNEQSCISDPGKALRDLANSHENWARVLIFPGKGNRNRGYGIRTEFPR
jgi:hypothetical protein